MAHRVVVTVTDAGDRDQGETREMRLPDQVRLPKTAEDPQLEAVPVPAMPHGYFLSARRLWEWKRTMEQLATGERMTRRLVASGVTT